MMSLLSALHDHPVQQFAPGELLIEQGDCTGRLYILIEGTVEVAKDGVTVTKANEPGAIFGDLAALLGVPHTAAVRSLTPCRFHVVPDGGGGDSGPGEDGGDSECLCADCFGGGG